MVDVFLAGHLGEVAFLVGLCQDLYQDACQRNYFKKRNAIKKYIIDVDMVITSLAIYGYLKG